jgi:hypothetical protein
MASWPPFFMYGPMSALLPDSGMSMPSRIGPLSLFLSSPPRIPWPQAEVTKAVAVRATPRAAFLIMSPKGLGRRTGDAPGRR